MEKSVINKTTTIGSAQIQPILLVQASILGSLIVAIYYAVMGSLANAWWEDSNYSHGFLVPFLSAYFVWERREKLQALIPQSNYWGVTILMAGILAFAVGSVGGGAFILQSSLIVVLEPSLRSPP